MKEAVDSKEILLWLTQDHNGTYKIFCTSESLKEANKRTNKNSPHKSKYKI